MAAWQVCHAQSGPDKRKVFPNCAPLQCAARDQDTVSGGTGGPAPAVVAMCGHFLSPPQCQPSASLRHVGHV